MNIYGCLAGHYFTRNARNYTFISLYYYDAINQFFDHLKKKKNQWLIGSVKSTKWAL
jgi:hypothetical protein